MKVILANRLARLEMTKHRGKVLDNMDDIYERMVQLGLGEVAPSADTDAGLRFERGLAWSYREMMVEFDSGKCQPRDDWERSILERYRARLASGLIHDFDFGKEDGIW